jgi:hypothetical protein
MVDATGKVSASLIDKARRTESDASVYSAVLRRWCDNSARHWPPNVDAVSAP